MRGRRRERRREGGTALAVALLAAVGLPRESGGGSGAPGRSARADEAVGPAGPQGGAIARLTGLATVLGLVSAVFWVFAPDFVTAAGGLSPDARAWMWVAVGAGGLVGGGAGDLIDRVGPTRTHAAALGALGVSLALLAALPHSLTGTLGASALFGAAYMTLTGFHLVRGTRIRSERPALGPVLPLVATASGQVVGSPAAGAVIEVAGHGMAFRVFAGAGVVVSIASLWLAAAREQGR